MKPEPKHINIVCTLCGLDWEKHDAKPTAEKCVELLKAELAKRPVWGHQIIGTSTTPPFYGTTSSASQ